MTKFLIRIKTENIYDIKIETNHEEIAKDLAKDFFQDKEIQFDESDDLSIIAHKVQLVHIKPIQGEGQ